MNDIGGKFLETLFKPEDGICFGNFKATKVYKNYPTLPKEFFSINPLHKSKDYHWMLKEGRFEKVGRRADINVTEFRNFLFEMDSVPLDIQLKILRSSVIPFTSIVFSGSKSYHAILSVEQSIVDEPHTIDGIRRYKHYWSRLAGFLDWEAKKNGFEYPDKRNTFFDSACKNPSRLSRYPGYMRDGDKLQDLIQLTSSISIDDFSLIINKCPEIVQFSDHEFDPPENELESIEDFQAIASPKLLRTLKFVDWAASEGVYPYMYRYTLWAIDETNVSRHTFIEFLEKYTFASLLKRGYPADKLMTAVNHAYREKRKY